MGCGKSKHDVATGNTISKSNTTNGDGTNKKNKDVETIPEKVTNNSNASVQQEEESKNTKEEVSPVKQEEEKGESKNGDSKVVAVVAKTEKEDVANVADSKEGDDKKDLKEKIAEGGVEEVKQELKTVDTVEAIVSNKVDVSEEGEKSINVLEEKGSVEEAKNETQNGTAEPVKVNEEKADNAAPATIESEAPTVESVKVNEEKTNEAAPATIEPEAPVAATTTATTKQEKTPSANQETVTESAAAELETN